MRISLRHVLAVVATLLVALAVPTAPAQAAGQVYDLTSLTVEGSITPTTEATVRFAFDGAFPRTIHAQFVNKADGTVRVVSPSLSSAQGSRTFSWDPKFTQGRYDLEKVWLVDTLPTGESERYEDDGKVYRGTVAVGTHSLNFGTVGFSITGPVTGELAPPRLLDADLVSSGSAYHPFSLRVVTADSRTTLQYVAVSYTNSTADTGDDLAVTRSGVPVGTAVIDGFARSGEHRAQRILVMDQYSQWTAYYADGRVVANNWTFPEKHTIDFSALDLSRPQGPVRHKPLRSRASVR